MACEIHLDDVGTIFRVTIVDCDDVFIDISTASVKQLVFKKPDGTSVTQTAVFFTDGTDGILDYVTVSGDLDLVGEGWKIQGKVTLATGNWSSDIGTFPVYDNL